MISTEVPIRTQFYDLDPMNIVWHGNYVRYLEQARAALLGGIGFGYREMKESGFAWPIVDLSIRYVRPLQLNQDFVVRATLTEYENRLCISYRVFDATSRGVLTKARTVQVAVSIETGEMSFEVAAAIDRLRTEPSVIRRRHFIAVAIGALAADGARAAQAQSLGLANGEVLRGRFTQQRFLQGFNAALTSSGSFIVAPGRGIVWRGEAPFAILTVMGPGGLVQRVAGGATTHYPASRLPAIARLYEIFAAALSGDWQKLAAVFDIRRDGTANDWTATLTPLRGGEGGMPLREVVVRGSRYVDSVEVTRTNGDRDRIDFSQQAPSRAPIDAESSELIDTAGRP